MRGFLKRLFFAAFIFLCFIVDAHSQENIILDSDSARPFEGFSRYFISPAAPEKTPVIGQVMGGEAVFKIVKVTNIQGNNPFNTSQPVYNFGGVLVANVDDLIECVRGGVCSPSGGGGGGSIICSPNSDVSDFANLKDSVGVYIKGNGTICRVEKLPSPSDLKYEALFVMYDKLTAKSTIAATDSVDYKMIKPPSGNSVTWPGGTVVYLVSNGTYTTEVHNITTGVKYRINFTVTNLPGNNVRLTVNSLTRI